MSSSKNGVPSAEQTLHRLLADIESQHGHVLFDAHVVKQIAESSLTNGVVNDREYLLENTIKAACSYSKESPTGQALTNKMLAQLWDNLKHPPLSHMGDQSRYRTADGSNNNMLYPDLGKAGSYYARSVVPQRPLSAALPAPEDIFDALFARRGEPKEHPTKFSSIAISMATVIIHDIFRTDDADPNKVACSSYLDLGPLYGHNTDLQNAVRTFKDGKMKPDTFAEVRILGQPPGVGALLISFNRFHNYVVEQLAIINEGGRFSLSHRMKPEQAAAKRDNDLFQTGRLITCGLYVNIILRDYVRVILNLNRVDTEWNLDPRDDFFDPFEQGTPKGIGNQVSMEFNLIYRWHATISKKNEDWCKELFKKIWPDKNPESLSQYDLYKGMAEWGKKFNDVDPGSWEFNGLKRNENGSFDDADLVGILTETTEDVAAAFGARNVPVALRAIEILGINQGRQWGTASLNEMREFFELLPHKTFKDINPDPDVAESLEALYGHPDNVELYPGLVCEDTKPPMAPGSGLCAGLTVAKAILSDAVALVRGDRFYTIDNSPANLTSFGFNEIASKQEIGFGTTIYKLLTRAYPGWYRPDSVYTLFPLTIPEENRKIMKDRNIEANYTYDAPCYIPELINSAAGDIGVSFEAEDIKEIDSLYEEITTDLIKNKSMRLRDRWQIDAVRHVANLSHAQVLAQVFRIPVTDELYELATAIYRYDASEYDDADALAVQTAAKKATTTLSAIVRKSCQQVDAPGNFLDQLIDGEDQSMRIGTKVVQRLLKTGGVEQVTEKVVHAYSAAVSVHCQGVVSLLGYYLEPENAKQWAEVKEISGGSDALDKLQKYVRFALDVSKGPAHIETNGGPAHIESNDGHTDVKTNGSYAAGKTDGGYAAGKTNGGPTYDDANGDAHDDTNGDAHGDTNGDAHGDTNGDAHGYTNESEVDQLTNGLLTDPLTNGHSANARSTSEQAGPPGRQLLVHSMAIQLRVFARLNGLRPAAGPTGQLKKMIKGTSIVYMDDTWSSWTPFPSNWKLYYDGE